MDADEGGELLGRVAMVRRQMAAELGLVAAPIRIRDNVQLGSHDYAVKIKGVRGGAQRRSMPGQLLAMNPGDADPSLEGIPTTEPAFGLPALWIAARRQREHAEAYGYTVVDPASVIITHLTEVIRAHADELLSRQDTKLLLDGAQRAQPGAGRGAGARPVSVGEVQRVLQTAPARGASRSATW